MGTCYAAYVDRPFTCVACEEPSMFSASEQQYWFETLQFLIWVYPKRCAPCRKKKRAYVAAQKALEEALKNLDRTDPEQLDRVAELYEAMGIEAKASLYRTWAKKHDGSMT